MGNYERDLGQYQDLAALDHDAEMLLSALIVELHVRGVSRRHIRACLSRIIRHRFAEL
ncbi:MAG: hypothetical protein ACKVI4_17900 [Actinomycetales bacterium]